MCQSHERATLAHLLWHVTRIAGVHGRAGKILVVEDDVDLRILYTETLRGSYHVSAAEDGVDGLEQLGRSRFDLVLLDLMMPRMGGAECECFCLELEPLTILVAPPDDARQRRRERTGRRACVRSSSGQKDCGLVGLESAHGVL